MRCGEDSYERPDPHVVLNFEMIVAIMIETYVDEDAPADLTFFERRFAPAQMVASRDMLKPRARMALVRREAGSSSLPNREFVTR